MSYVIEDYMGGDPPTSYVTRHSSSGAIGTVLSDQDIFEYLKSSTINNQKDE